MAIEVTLDMPYCASAFELKVISNINPRPQLKLKVQEGAQRLPTPSFPFQPACGNCRRADQIAVSCRLSAIDYLFFTANATNAPITNPPTCAHTATPPFIVFPAVAIASAN